jgi:hypothetical protein
MKAARAVLVSRFPSGSPRLRSCDASDQPAFSSRASRNAASAERENGTAVDRFPPTGRGSSPLRSPCAGFRRSMPSHQSALPAPRSRARIAKQDFHFPFQQHVRLLSFVAFADEGIAGRELERGGFVTKKLRGIHEYNVIGSRDYKGEAITAKLRLCDNRSDADRANSSCPSWLAFNERRETLPV